MTFVEMTELLNPFMSEGAARSLEPPEQQQRAKDVWN
jgi:hypothetical protein